MRRFFDRIHRSHEIYHFKNFPRHTVSKKMVSKSFPRQLRKVRPHLLLSAVSCAFLPYPSTLDQKWAASMVWYPTTSETSTAENREDSSDLDENVREFIAAVRSAPCGLEKKCFENFFRTSRGRWNGNLSDNVNGISLYPQRYVPIVDLTEYSWNT